MVSPPTFPGQGMAVLAPSLSPPIQPKPLCPALPPQAPPLALWPFSAVVVAGRSLLPPMPRTRLTGGLCGTEGGRGPASLGPTVDSA